MLNIRSFLRCLFACLILAAPAFAQTLPGSPVYQTWFPQANSPSVAVTTSSSAHLYPSAGPTARICNTGSADAYLNPFGTSNTVTATTNGFWLPSSACISYNIKPSTTQYTYYAAITAAGTTTLYIETGLGALGSLSGGAGGSGGAAGGDLAGSYPNPQVAAFSALAYRAINFASHTPATSADTIIGCDSSGGNVNFKILPTLGSLTHQKRIRIKKTSSDTNTCCISTDGSTCLAYLINQNDEGGAGWLDVDANGTSLSFTGTP